MSPAEIAKRLGELPFGEAKAAALEQAAALIADVVGSELSGAPGDAHDHPWKRSGLLRASIRYDVVEDEAVIGSDDPVAVFQEAGTMRTPPRPFLSSVAERLAEPTARSIARIIGDALG